MKISEFIKKEALNWLFILLSFLYIIIVYDKMPRFTLSQINIYYGLLFVMGNFVIWYIITLIKPSTVPKTAYHDHLKSFYRLKTIIFAFLSLLSMTFISEAIRISLNWSKIGFILAGVFMAAIGNFYPTIRYNYFIGIRNSCTRSSELIWNKTHQFAGKIFFGVDYLVLSMEYYLM